MRSTPLAVLLQRWWSFFLTLQWHLLNGNFTVITILNCKTFLSRVRRTEGQYEERIKDKVPALVIDNVHTPTSVSTDLRLGYPLGKNDFSTENSGLPRDHLTHGPLTLSDGRSTRRAPTIIGTSPVEMSIPYSYCVSVYFRPDLWAFYRWTNEDSFFQTLPRETYKESSVSRPKQLTLTQCAWVSVSVLNGPEVQMSHKI